MNEALSSQHGKAGKLTLPSSGDCSLSDGLNSHITDAMWTCRNISKSEHRNSGLSSMSSVTVEVHRLEKCLASLEVVPLEKVVPVDLLLQGYRRPPTWNHSSYECSKRQCLGLLPRVECSDTIRIHCSLQLLGSSNSPASASKLGGTIAEHYPTHLIFLFCYCLFIFILLLLFFETGSCSVTPGRVQWCHHSSLQTSNSWPQVILLPQPVTATREAEAGGSLEPRSLRLL
ncbi:uncharacterized protein LOC142874349 [Microcebus murinus]|uniref:uncharacterized protein LOC142874349 n=1 Tax=Microcebus murinus TaxID=30608 RepID=UPI003F6BADBF